jgi:error-prone DNA polymerase
MNMLPRLRPRSFYDLVIEVAIVRPGPIQGDMVHPYLRRRNSEEAVDIPEGLEGVLAKTLGVPLFQEQAMQIAIVGAGFSPSRADELRRAMATFRNTGEIWKLRNEFIGGMTATATTATSPSAASASSRASAPMASRRATPRLRAARLCLRLDQAHHPAAFACALLNSQPMGFYAPAQIVRMRGSMASRSARPTCCTATGTARWSPMRAAPAAWRCGSACGWCRGWGRRRRSGSSRPGRHAPCPISSAAPRSTAARWSVWPRPTPSARSASTAAPRCGRRRAVEAPPAAGPTCSRRRRACPRQRAGEQTVLDYTSTGLSLRQHPLALLRPLLEAERLADTRVLNAAKRGTWIRLPGLVLVRQRRAAPRASCSSRWRTMGLGEPGRLPRPSAGFPRRSGRRAAGRRGRPGGAARGGGPIIHLIVRRLTDRSELLAGLAALDDPARAPWHKALAARTRWRSPTCGGIRG